MPSDEEIKEFLKSKGCCDSDYMDSGMVEHITELMEEYASQTEMPSVVKTKQILVGFKDWYNRQRKSPILFVEIDEYLSQLKGGE